MANFLAGDDIRGVSSNTQESNALAEFRRAMLAADSYWELRRILYELERFLAQNPFSPEGRLLKDRLEAAINQAVYHATPLERKDTWDKRPPMALPAIRWSLLSFICLSILFSAILGGVLYWQTARSDSCVGVMIEIREPTNGEEVSAKVDVSGTSTVHEPCRYVFIVTRDRSAPVWKITDLVQVNTTGQWAGVAKLDGIPVSGEAEVAVRVTAQPTDYRIGQEFPIPPLKGIPSDVVHVRRIQ